VYPTRISVAWTASVDNVTQVYYSLFVDGSLYFGGQIGLRETTILDLAPSTTHTFKITARDGFGNVVESNILSVTTPAATDTVPPTAPSNLSLSSESAAPEIWRDWNQSTDNSDPQSQIMYDVYLDGVPEHPAIAYGETNIYCREEGPTAIVMRAVDTSGNVSAPSNEIMFNC
jgi:chitinase